MKSHSFGLLLEAFYGSTGMIVWAACVGAIIALSAWLAFSKAPCLASWSMKAILALEISLPPLFLIRWDTSSVWLRWALALALLIGLAWGLASQLRSRASAAPGVSRLLVAAVIVCAPIFIAQAAEIIRAYAYRDAPVRLAFPLADGIYAVAQGGDGDSPAMNYHYTGPERLNPGNGATGRYATDITKLGPLGWGRPFFIRQLEDSPVFGERIYCPCDGTVLHAYDAANDISPRGKGNYLIILARDGERRYIVLLAHIKQGSLMVRLGQVVAKGEPVARAGNAGQGGALYPHLHIQANAYDPSGPFGGFGASLPMLFDGRFPVMNGLFYAGAIGP